METYREISVSGKELKYYLFPAKSKNKPIIFIFHGHGFNGQPARFRSDNWNVVCPIDNSGLDDLGSWYLGESGNYYWLDAIPKIVKQVKTETQGSRLFFWGSSMGGYAALLHGYFNNVDSVYANLPQTLLMGSKYAQGGMDKYFSWFTSEENKFNDLTKIFTTRSRKKYFLCFNQLEGSDYFNEQGLRFINKLQEIRQPMYLEVRPYAKHGINHSISESIGLFKKYAK